MLADLVPILTSASFSPDPDEKVCGRCKESKPFSAFATSNRYSGGLKLQRWCKECHRQVNRLWYRQQNLREGCGMRVNPTNFK